MSFNVSTFASRGLPLGGARPSLFEVFMTLPGGVGEPAAEAQFSFVCRAAQIPTSTVGVIEVPYFGRKIKIAGKRLMKVYSRVGIAVSPVLAPPSRIPVFA